MAIWAILHVDVSYPEQMNITDWCVRYSNKYQENICSYSPGSYPKTNIDNVKGHGKFNGVRCSFTIASNIHLSDGWLFHDEEG